MGNLHYAQACGMLGSSGWGGMKGGGILQFDLAPQEALRRLGERALYAEVLGPLEQGTDPGRAAARTCELQINTKRPTPFSYRETIKAYALA